MDSIRQRLDSHSEMIVSTKKDIEIMKVGVIFTKNFLKKKVDGEEFEALERRATILEAKGGKGGDLRFSEFAGTAFRAVRFIFEKF